MVKSPATDDGATLAVVTRPFHDHSAFPQVNPQIRPVRVPTNCGTRDLGTLLNHYVRPAEALATTTSRDLGL